MRLYILISLLICTFFMQNALGQAVLLEDNKRVRNSRTAKKAANSLEFRHKRKVGVGVGAAGAYGMAGLNIELNFTPETSFQTQFGIADIFQSFGFSIKRVVGGKYFAPYIAGGMARWYTVTENNPIEKTTPSFLAEKFLSDEEKASGEFAETMLYPALGIQYNQLTGSWAGASFYAEILLLVDIDDFQSAPTGALGYTYFF